MTFDWFGSQRTRLNSKEVFGHFTKDSLGCRRLCREGRNWPLLLGLGDAEAINPVKRRVIKLIYGTVCIRWENVQRLFLLPFSGLQCLPITNLTQSICNVRNLVTSIALMKMRGLPCLWEADKNLGQDTEGHLSIFQFLLQLFPVEVNWFLAATQELAKKPTSNAKLPCPIRKKRHSWFSPQLSLGQSL